MLTPPFAVVEQYRLLEGMIKVIQEVDSRTHQPICNPHTCPTMSAAEYVFLVSCKKVANFSMRTRFTYTWLDNYRNPIRIPACQYITLVQKWIMGKINDSRIFPVFDVFELAKHRQAQAPHPYLGKDSGFPESFETDIKSLYRQMFRCYAHIYHGHWQDPFYNLGAYKELNTCFIHFVNVGKLFNLLEDRDMKPMQPLVDIWIAKGLLPVAQVKQAAPSQVTSPSVGAAGTTTATSPPPAAPAGGGAGPPASTSSAAAPPTAA